MKEWKEWIWYFDMEVLAHDWLLCAISVNGDRVIFHNEPKALMQWIDDTQPILCGYNSKHYDMYILKAILASATPEDVKEVNDAIIVKGVNGWEIDMGWIKLPSSIDLMLDLATRPSLKLIEGNLKMDIRESTIDFNTEYPTKTEWKEMEEYCWHDVEALIPLFKIRLSYLEAKETLANLGGIDVVKALNMTNAKLTSVFLGATRVPHNDERKYVYPTNIDRNFIPAEVFEFFDRLPNSDIPLDVLFGKEGVEDENGKIVKSRNPYRALSIDIAGCPSKVAWGGLHGALKNYREVSNTNGRIIMNVDVTSYYPSLMINNHYLSRNIDNSKKYELVYNQRVEAKKTHDIKIDKALKLVLNTTFGASNTKYNDMFDPLMAHSICISGQLYLIQLAERLYKQVPKLKIIQLNTDGIMFSIEEDTQPKVLKILDSWQDSTGLGLDYLYIDKVVQRDVNNYVMQKDNGDIKCKGGVLSDWKGGSFVHNSLSITCKAVVEHLLHDTPISKTINECNDPFAFQMISKAGRTFNTVKHEVKGILVPVNKVNRIYAGKDKDNGMVYKMKGERKNKIPDCPPNAIVDNSGKITIDKLDKEWYIDITQQRVDKFLGKEKKRMSKKAVEATTDDDFDDIEVIDETDTEDTPVEDTKIKTTKVSHKRKTPVKKEVTEEVKEPVKEEVKKETSPVEKQDTVEVTTLGDSEKKIIPTLHKPFREKLFDLAHDMANAGTKFVQDGYNSNQSYEYVKASQYKTVFRNCLAKNRLMHKVDDAVCNISDGLKSDKMVLTLYHGAITIFDVDSKEKESYMIWAQGADTLDKGLSKAKTLAIKDFIKANYLLSDKEDDPEEDVTPVSKDTGKKLKPKFMTPQQKEESKTKVMLPANLCNKDVSERIIKAIEAIRVSSEKPTYGAKVIEEVIAGVTGVRADVLLTKLEMKGDEYGLVI